jgi:hypothetical protein
VRSPELAYDGAVEERAACAQLKKRFEAAGFRIKEHQSFDEDGVRFDIDGFDADRRVGYEYVTDEAGDGWDVDDEVIAALAERGKRGEIHVLIVDEDDAPDAAALDAAIDAFLKALPKTEVAPEPDVADPADVIEDADAPEPAAKPRPAARKPPPPTPRGAKKKPARKSR